MEKRSRIACSPTASVAENTQNKADLRRILLTARDAVCKQTRDDNDSAIRKALIAFFRRRPVRTLGIYWPIRSEPDVRETYTELAALGISLALPVADEKHAPLDFAVWTPGMPLVKDAMGVPAPGMHEERIWPEAILVPCVGFNAQGYRLGYGGGFYDRTLGKSPRPLAIGIAYSDARVAFAADDHDVALDVILTESAVVDIKASVVAPHEPAA